VVVMHESARDRRHLRDPILEARAVLVLQKSSS
jgi:hypothetical protein